MDLPGNAPSDARTKPTSQAATSAVHWKRRVMQGFQRASDATCSSRNGSSSDRTGCRKSTRQAQPWRSTALAAHDEQQERRLDDIDPGDDQRDEQRQRRAEQPAPPRPQRRRPRGRPGARHGRGPGRRRCRSPAGRGRATGARPRSPPTRRPARPGRSPADGRADRAGSRRTPRRSPRRPRAHRAPARRSCAVRGFTVTATSKTCPSTIRHARRLGSPPGPGLVVTERHEEVERLEVEGEPDVGRRRHGRRVGVRVDDPPEDLVGVVGLDRQAQEVGGFDLVAVRRCGLVPDRRVAEAAPPSPAGASPMINAARLVRVLGAGLGDDRVADRGRQHDRGRTGVVTLFVRHRSTAQRPCGR